MFNIDNTPTDGSTIWVWLFLFGLAYLVVILIPAMSKAKANSERAAQDKRKHEREEELHAIRMERELLKNAQIKAGKSASKQVRKDKRDDQVESEQANVKQTPSKKKDDGLEKGRLIEFGKANFKFKDDANSSYFVKLENQSGDMKTLWGIGLEDALKNAEVNTGDVVSLKRGKKEPVTVIKLIRNEEGKVLRREPFDTKRQTWSCKVIKRLEKKEKSAEASAEAE